MKGSAIFLAIAMLASLFVPRWAVTGGKDSTFTSLELAKRFDVAHAWGGISEVFGWVWIAIIAILIIGAFSNQAILMMIGAVASVAGNLLNFFVLKPESVEKASKFFEGLRTLAKESGAKGNLDGGIGPSLWGYIGLGISVIALFLIVTYRKDYGGGAAAVGKRGTNARSNNSHVDAFKFDWEK